MSISSASFVFQTFLMVLPVMAVANYPLHNTFQWSLPNLTNPTTDRILPSCGVVQVGIIPNISNIIAPTPPYYLLAYEIGGTPQRTLLGDDASSDFNWHVTHEPGTTLWLEVVDAAGSSGGVVQTFTVADSGSSACTPSISNSFVVTAKNRQIQTCDSWSISIKGGSPPYNVTILTSGSPIVTNISLSASDNALSYVNRADPLKTLLAAVSDSSGAWAWGTPMVTTSGASDTTCPGKDTVGFHSDSDNSTNSDNPSNNAPPDNAAPRRPGLNAALVAGVIAGGIGAFLLFIMGFFLWRFRNRRPILKDKDNLVEIIPDSVPQPYPRSTVREPLMRKYASSEETDQLFSSTQYGQYGSSAASQTPLNTNTFSTSKLTLVNSEADENAPSTSYSRIIQHRDSVEVVTEVPPPYRDKHHIQVAQKKSQSGFVDHQPS